MPEAWNGVVNELLARSGGPLHLRLLIQPLVATSLAIRAGLRDATRINEPMKLAAAQALAELARRGKVVPQIVRDAYGNENFELGPDYIIPKPFDPRLLTYVVPAVAQAAMDSGVARQKLDIVEYGQQLGKTSAILSNM